MFRNYIKLTFKVLKRRKMFTFINLFGISFTLTILLAATTIYTLMVVANPVQKKLSRTLVMNQVAFRDKVKGGFSAGPAMPYFIEQAIRPLEKDVELISFCSRFSPPITIYLKNQRLDINIKETDENFWKIYSFKFLEGRAYEKQDIISNPQVIVICKTIKEKVFGNAPAFGKVLRFNNKNYKVVGVVDDIPAIYLSPYSQLWLPYNYASYVRQVNEKVYDGWNYQVLVLAKSKGDFGTIRKKFRHELTLVKSMRSSNDEVEAKLESSFEFVFKSYSDRSKGQFMLVAFAILFSFIPLLNLTNLTVSRIYERASEIGVRKAFGATKANMAMQFVYENIVVTLLGGILGFLGAWLLLKGIDASGLMHLGDVNFSLRVYLYGLIIILIFGVISGFYPAMKMSKLQIIKKSLSEDNQVLSVSFCTFADFPYYGNVMSSCFDLKKKQHCYETFDTDPDFAKTAGLKVIEGRWINEEDRISNEKPCVINKRLKEELFGSMPAEGKILTVNEGEDMFRLKIVGTVEHIKRHGEFSDEPNFLMSAISAKADYCPWNGILVRLKDPIPGGYEATLVNKLIKLDNSFDYRVEKLESLRRQYLMSELAPIVIVGAVVIFLIVNVMLGLFGSLWLSISRRKPEIGLRRAVGSTSRSVLWQILCETYVLAWVSMIPGLILTSQIFIFNIYDTPVATLIQANILAFVIIMVLCTISAFAPARLASRLRPAEALHEE